MPIALSSQSLPTTQPLDEDIRLAAISGFPWLVLDVAKMQAFLTTPDFDIRDLTRLFLRTQAAALDGLVIESPDPAHLPLLESLCKEARRVKAPLLVVRCDAPDSRLAAFGDVAQRWSTVLTIVPPTGQFSYLNSLLNELDHPALGIYLDIVALYQGGESLTPEETARVAIVAVSDEDADATPVLPGNGLIPVAPLLAPLQEAGFNGLYVLNVPYEGEAENVEAWVREGRNALLEVLAQIGWRDESDEG